MNKQPLIVIVGPTGVGKTNLSLNLAESLQGAILSADSMQVYQGLDLGTAKATLEDQERVKHYLLDLVSPAESFNVADYIKEAEEVLELLEKKQQTPILVGGTGLYIDALLDGFLFPHSSADLELRKKLEQQDQEELYKELLEVDPVSAKKIHRNDQRRIIRALEVYRRTGETISSLQRKHEQTERPYKPLYLGLTRERDELYSRINTRVDQMIEAGLVEEVRELLVRFPKQPTALQALGYKEIVLYLKGELSLLEATELLKRDTRRYAKRQLSWFRRNKRINWFNLSELSEQEVLAASLKLWASF